MALHPLSRAALRCRWARSSVGRWCRNHVAVSVAFLTCGVREGRIQLSPSSLTLRVTQNRAIREKLALSPACKDQHAGLADEHLSDCTMNTLYQAALEARVTLAAPFRRSRLRAMSERSAAPISVLFYHRVADAHPNDWTICREQFRRHIEYCRERFDLVDLPEVQRRVSCCDSPRPAVSFTFDDGYAENCDFALPLLVEHRVPCTYFVTTSNIRDQKPFPHDVQAGVNLPVNSVAQLRQAASAGIEIGLHTRSHVDFSRVHDARVVHHEIVDAKDELEQMIGRAVRYFAFPYGMPWQLTQAAIEAVHAAGLAGFCSAYGGYNLVGRDAFHIRRCHGDPIFSRLRNWLSFDGGKVRREPNVRYFLPPANSFQASLVP